MRRVILSAPVAVAHLVLAAGVVVAAEGALRLSWDGCEPIVANKDFAGEGRGQIATLVLSVRGADRANNGHRTVIVMRPDLPEAWRFDGSGCQSGLLEVRHSGVSPACPAFQGGRPLNLYLFDYEEGSRRGVLDIANTYDTFTPSAGQRYTLWQARFDHSYSTAAGGDAGVICRFAGDPLCFQISVDVLPPEILLADGAKGSFSIERDWVTWQDPVNAMNCPQIQAEESTWGRVKGMYR